MARVLERAGYDSLSMAKTPLTLFRVAYQFKHPDGRVALYSLLMPAKDAADAEQRVAAQMQREGQPMERILILNTRREHENQAA